MKKYQDGGKTGAQLKKEGAAMKAKGQAMKAEGKAMKEKGRVMAVEGRKSDFVKFGDKVFGTKPGDIMQQPYPFQKGGATKKYKTGGMVNSNAKVSALKLAGSKGVKSGVNLKAAVSKIAKGRVGGTSTAPKKAVPQAKMGGAMKRKSC